MLKYIFMNTFKKSESNLGHSLKLPIAIDIKEMQREFEDVVKANCIPSVSDNKKRKGWKKYVIYRHPEYLRPDSNEDFVYSQLPYLNKIISEKLKGSVLVAAVYAIIPPQGFVGLHQDAIGSNSSLLKKRIEDTVRLHIPIYTNKETMLYIGNQFQRMLEGELWMLNNYSYHGVLNQNENLSRNHLIFDVIPSPDFLHYLESIPDPKGFKNAKVLKHLLQNSNENKVEAFKNQLPLLEKLKLNFA